MSQGHLRRKDLTGRLVAAIGAQPVAAEERRGIAGRAVQGLRLRWTVLNAMARGYWLWCRRRSLRHGPRAQARLLLAGTSAERRAKRVARRQFVERRVTYLLEERYRLVRDVPVRGVKHLDAALADGRGAVLGTVHLGYTTGVPYRLAFAGFPALTVASGTLKHRITGTSVGQRG